MYKSSSIIERYVSKKTPGIIICSRSAIITVIAAVVTAVIDVLVYRYYY